MNQHRNTASQFIAKAAAARNTGDLTQAARYTFKARTAPESCDCQCCALQAHRDAAAAEWNARYELDADGFVTPVR